jgi:hypothetical protein
MRQNPLPAEMIDPVKKPDYTPRFERIDIQPDGRVAFVARSAAFRPTGAVRVESADSGRTWAVVPL